MSHRPCERCRCRDRPRIRCAPPSSRTSSVGEPRRCRGTAGSGRRAPCTRHRRSWCTGRRHARAAPGCSRGRRPRARAGCGGGWCAAGGRRRRRGAASVRAEAGAAGAGARGSRTRRPGRWRGLRGSGAAEAALADGLESLVDPLHAGHRGRARVAVGVPLRDQLAPGCLDLWLGGAGFQAQFGKGVVGILFHVSAVRSVARRRLCCTAARSALASRVRGQEGLQRSKRRPPHIVLIELAAGASFVGAPSGAMQPGHATGVAARHRAGRPCRSTKAALTSFALPCGARIAGPSRNSSSFAALSATRTNATSRFTRRFARPAMLRSSAPSIRVTIDPHGAAWHARCRFGSKKLELNQALGMCSLRAIQAAAAAHRFDRTGGGRFVCRSAFRRDAAWACNRRSGAAPCGPPVPLNEGGPHFVRAALRCSHRRPVA